MNWEGWRPKNPEILYKIKIFSFQNTVAFSIPYLLGGFPQHYIQCHQSVASISRLMTPLICNCHPKLTSTELYGAQALTMALWWNRRMAAWQHFFDTECKNRRLFPQETLLRWRQIHFHPICSTQVNMTS